MSTVDPRVRCVYECEHRDLCTDACMLVHMCVCWRICVYGAAAAASSADTTGLAASKIPVPRTHVASSRPF
jgi:hypothetical protein